MARFDVYISDDGLADINGEPVVPERGESVHDAVLDRLQRYAEEHRTPVEATVTDGPGAPHFVLEVSPDGSSRVLLPTETRLAERPAETPEPPPSVPVPTTASKPAPALLVAMAPAPSTALTTTSRSTPATTPLLVAPPVTHNTTSATAASTATSTATPTSSAPATPTVSAAVPTSTPDRETPTPPQEATAPTAPNPAPAPPPVSALAAAVARARAKAVAQAPGDTPVIASVPISAIGADIPEGIAERIGHIKALAAIGRLDEAFADASALREGLTGSAGTAHPHTLEARVVEARMAHLRGDHREATVLALAVARIRCGAGDERASAEVARAAAAWQQLDDDRAAVVHGRELLYMWDRLRTRGPLPPGHAELAERIRGHVEELETYV